MVKKLSKPLTNPSKFVPHPATSSVGNINKSVLTHTVTRCGTKLAKQELIDVQPLIDIIKLTLQTAYVKGIETPVNLLIIAKPESVKTKAMEKFKIKGTYTTNNITSHSIAYKILPMIERQGLKHLIIPDFLNAVEKDSRTAKSTINLFKVLTEEGVTSLDQFYIKTEKVYNPPVKCGLITGITTKGYYGEYNPITQRTEGGVKNYWRNIGFLSRLVPFTYHYELSKIRKVMEYIENEEHEKPLEKEKLKYKVSEVKGNSGLFKQLEIVSMTVGSKADAYGFRLQRDLQYLAKANVLLRGDIEVTQEDIEKILYLSNWINYDFNIL